MLATLPLPSVAAYLKWPNATIKRLWLAGVRAVFINDACVSQFQLLAANDSVRYLNWETIGR